MNPHLANALWLVSALPGWYFGALAAARDGGILFLIPAAGTASLLAGAVLILTQRRLGPLFCAGSVVLSECYVALAGALRGQLPGKGDLLPSCLFLLVQLSFTGYLVYRSKGARAAALALTVFCLSYAFFALFVGGMAFADDWI